MTFFRTFAVFLLFLAVSVLIGPPLTAQSAGSSSSVTGTVTDPTGAVVPGATVEIRNPVSGFSRTTSTDTSGKFSIPNVPFNPYQVSVRGQGFAAYSQDIDVRSLVPISLSVALKVGGFCRERNRGSEWGRPLGERSHLSHRCRPGIVRQDPTGKCVLFGKFAGYSSLPGNRRRFQRSLSRHGRSRREFVLGRWPAHHRPAEQGVLQPDSSRFDPVDGGHFRRAAR